MTLTATTLAAGPGWLVQDIVCRAGPRDRPFEEMHEAVSVSAVLRGTFRYRSVNGSALMVPGGVLLGNHGTCFECGHEHGAGDRCLAFQFAPDYWEDVVSAAAGARRAASFSRPGVPPSASLLPLMAEVEAARDGDGEELEEVGLRFAGAVLAAETGEGDTVRPPGPREIGRVWDAVRRIEEGAGDIAGASLSVGRLARQAGMSPYHFLRTFRAVVGMTPHQYVLRTRMQRAAVAIRRTDEPISSLALDAGFADLSTFNRRFRRVMGASPTEYRRAARSGARRARSPA
jgi:AraC-like DNA-binding protein